MMTQKFHYWWVEPFLSKAYHFLNECTNKYHSRKRFSKANYNFSRNISTITLEFFLKRYGSFFQNFLKNCTNRVPLDMSIYLPIFLVNYKSSFDYYKQGQTRNPRACYTIFFQKMHECSSYS